METGIAAAAVDVTKKIVVKRNLKQKTKTVEKTEDVAAAAEVVAAAASDENVGGQHPHHSVDDTVRTGKTVRTVRSADDYETMTHRENVLREPDIYIGSAVPTLLKRHVYDIEGEKMILNKEIQTCEGFERLFVEILSNSVDNIISSRHFIDQEKKTPLYTFTAKHPPVSVVVDGSRVVVKNGGAPIPIAPHKTSNEKSLILLPNIIFGQLLSSSNYNKDVARIGAGKNGYGAKLTNIFSKVFTVKIGDPINGQEYTGIWSDNMSRVVKSEAKPGFKWDASSSVWKSAASTSSASTTSDQSIVLTRGRSCKPYTGNAYVEVSYEIDFERFKGFGASWVYTKDMTNLFARIALDYSFTAKIPISFNAVHLDARLARSFVKYYFPEQADKIVIHYEWASKTDAERAAAVGTGKDAISKAISNGTLTATPVTELIVIDTPDSAMAFGFVNGLCVPDGAHVYEAIVKVSSAIVSACPSALTSSKTTAGLTSLTTADVRPHFSVIVSCHLFNPVYTSQTKQILSEPRPRISISPDVFKTAMNSSSENIRWAIGTRIAETLEFKTRKAASKTDGTKKKRVVVEGASHANFAGTSQSQECTLWLTEGDSAAAYTEKRVFLLEGKKDLHGIFGCRGKFINVKAASQSMLYKNKEYLDIKQLLGLAEGADYTKQDVAKTLRYGRIVIAADADEDGAAIRALLINCFACRWPSLVKSGRIAYLATPAIRITNPKTGEVVERFYSDSAYYDWEKANPGKSRGLRVRHLKGLASSNDQDIKDDLSTAPTIHIVYDDSASEALDLAFSSKRADDRKKWIENWRQTGAALPSDDVVLEPLSRALSLSLPAAPPTKRGSSFPTLPSPPTSERTISAVINHDLAEYSFSSLFRALPSCDDGLKRSQRQALWHCLNFWNFGVGEGLNKESQKVSRLASAVAEATSYAHGETSMQGALIGMAQNFTGSNNLTALFPDGQFGSRISGTKGHGAARYLYTKVDWCVPYLFSKEALSLVPRRMVEGELVETTWIPCDIPLFSVVNGVRGIATGWSCFIPCHNPLEVTDWIINKLSFPAESLAATTASKKEPSIWYRGFEGNIEVVEKKALSKSGGIVDDVEDVDDVYAAIDDDADADDGDFCEEASFAVSTAPKPEEFLQKCDTFRSMVSHGRFKVIRFPTPQDPTYDAIVDEIPVGVWSKDYLKWLEELAVAGTIGDVMDTSQTAEKPSFLLKKISTQAILDTEKKTSDKKKAVFSTDKKRGGGGSVAADVAAAASAATQQKFPPPLLTEKMLKLMKSQALNNMILINEAGVPKRYRSVAEIMETHFEKMFSHYSEIKKARIRDAEESLKRLIAKHSLLDTIVNGKLVVFKRPEDDIVREIRCLKLSEEEYHVLKIKDCTSEKVAQLFQKIEESRKLLEEIKAKPHSDIWKERLLVFRDVFIKKMREREAADEAALLSASSSAAAAHVVVGPDSKTSSSKKINATKTTTTKFKRVPT